MRHQIICILCKMIDLYANHNHLLHDTKTFTRSKVNLFEQPIQPRLLETSFWTGAQLVSLWQKLLTILLLALLHFQHSNPFLTRGYLADSSHTTFLVNKYSRHMSSHNFFPDLRTFSNCPWACTFFSFKRIKWSPMGETNIWDFPTVQFCISVNVPPVNLSYCNFWECLGLD